MDTPLQTVTPFQRYLEKLLDRYKGTVEGKVADYIPELSRARPEWFGIALDRKSVVYGKSGDLGGGGMV